MAPFSSRGAAFMAAILALAAFPGASASGSMSSGLHASRAELRPSPPQPPPEPGSYAWPVRGPVLRAFEEPPDPFAAGHRGIDIGVPFGTEIVAAQEGVVAFAGWVAGALYISIDHPDGIRTTYSWISGSMVQAGEVVDRGQPVGWSGQGHPESSTPHLHFGARIDTTYIDPMTLLEPWSVAGLIHLAPLVAA